MKHRVEHVFREWWSRPCGGSAVVALALPLVLSTASWTVMHFIDRVFLTWYSRDAIAAAMPAGLAHFLAICLPLGIAGYVNTFVAQFYGANERERIGLVVWQGIFLGLLTVPLFWLSIFLAPVIFDLGGHVPSVRQLETEYFQAMSYGAGAVVTSAAMAAFFTGLGRSRVVMVTDMLAASLNVGLDYVFIFGYGVIPEMGIGGAGLATSISQWVKVVVYGLIILRPMFCQTYHFKAGFRVDRPLLLRLLRYGGPNGIHVFIEVAVFTILTFQMGRLGELELAATTIVFSVNSIAFVPMLGLGIAVSTMVGQQLGGNNPGLAERATWTALHLGIFYTGGMAAFYLLFPDVFLMAHAAGGSTDFDQLRNVCHVLLRFVAAYCVVDMVQIVFSSAIKGAGDTRFVLFVTAIWSPVPVFLGWLGLNYWDWTIDMFWWIVTIWIWLLSVVFLTRFYWGPWRQMRVIETAKSAELSVESLPDTV